jgi:hypothetical protein
MKANLTLLVFLIFFLFHVAEGAFAQDEDKEPWFWVGPRVGLTGVIATLEDFNGFIQAMYPSERSYFLLYSQIGLGVEQRIRLGESKSHLSFQEVLLVGGLDQNIALPSFTIFMAFQSSFGLVFGLGPEIGIRGEEEKIVPTLSLFYALGWNFSFRGITIPVILTVVPTPFERKPRLSLLSGLTFGISTEKKARRISY